MPYTAGGCHRQEKPVRIFKCIKIYLCYFNCKVIHTKKDHLVLPKIFLCLSNDNVVKSFPCRHEAGLEANNVNNSTKKIKQNTRDWNFFCIISVWLSPLWREGRLDCSGDDCIFSDCNLHGRFFFFLISLLHTGYTEGLEARYGACHATRRDKRQTNIWVAPSNPDQSVCQEPDKLTGRRGHKRWKEWVMAVGM